MKIARIETYPVHIPVKPPLRIISSLGEHRESKYVLVRVLTEDGLEGAGEATVMPKWSGETVWGAQAVIDHLFAPLLVGQDPRDIPAVHRVMDRACNHNWFAKAAIEMACYDIAGKAAGVPVYKLLGGPHRSNTVRCRFSMGAYPPDRARRRAAELIAEGFTTIKVKVGTDKDQDVERVRIVRETIGPDYDITIDANCGYDASTAIAAARAMAPYGVVLFEQPTPDGDYEAMAEVRRNISFPVMADDILFNRIHAEELIRHKACDVMSLYPGKNGGIFKSKEIGDLAEAHGIPCSIGSNLELDVGTAAMAHLVLGCRNMQVEKYPGDMLGPHYHEVSVLKEPIRIEGPLVTISDRPGLGVDVDWDVVRRVRCS